MKVGRAFLPDLARGARSWRGWHVPCAGQAGMPDLLSNGYLPVPYGYINGGADYGATPEAW